MMVMRRPFPVVVGTKEMKNRVLMQCDTDWRPGSPISVKTDGLKKRCHWPNDQRRGDTGM